MMSEETNQIKRMQRYLSWLALYTGKIDGDHGRLTNTAIGILREHEGYDEELMPLLERKIKAFQLPDYNTPEELADAVKLVCAQMYKTKTVYPAYMMATVQHETGGDFMPVEEGDHLSPNVAKRVRAGLRYRPYWARGLVGLTHGYNYKKYGDILGIDLVSNPDLALRKDMALFILCHGCITGAFTTHTIGQYVLGDKVDLIQMRRVVNGVRPGEVLPDRAELIAGYCENRWMKYYAA